MNRARPSHEREKSRERVERIYNSVRTVPSLLCSVTKQIGMPFENCYTDGVIEFSRLISRASSVACNKYTHAGNQTETVCKQTVNRLRYRDEN